VLAKCGCCSTFNLSPMRLACTLLLALSLPTLALAQPSGYRALEELGDTRQEARQIRVFEARAGESVKTTLTRWSVAAGWAKPGWQLPGDSDFALASTARFEGDFKTATRSLISALPSGTGLAVRFDEPGRRAVVFLRDRPTQ